MDVLNLYDVEFSSIQGYDGRAIVQTYSRDDAELIVRKALEENDCITTPSDVYDIEELDPGEEPSILLLGVNR